MVIGIGNPDRGDDAAGRAVARLLRDKLPPGILAVEETGEVSTLMTRLEGLDRAWLVDACTSDGRPGTLLRFDASEEPLPENTFSLSTHGMGLGEAIELARALGQLPRLCIVYAIEARTVEHGTALSPAVSEAVDRAARQLLTEIGNAGAREDA
jgi:hydrogenase maturation protease